MHEWSYISCQSCPTSVENISKRKSCKVSHHIFFFFLKSGLPVNAQIRSNFLLLLQEKNSICNYLFFPQFFMHIICAIKSYVPEGELGNAVRCGARNGRNRHRQYNRLFHKRYFCGIVWSVYRFLQGAIKQSAYDVANSS